MMQKAIAAGWPESVAVHVADAFSAARKLSWYCQASLPMNLDLAMLYGPASGYGGTSDYVRDVEQMSAELTRALRAIAAEVERIREKSGELEGPPPQAAEGV